ncbi:ABC transporter substrate-binding protein [Paramicrobacterium chengjingii]|uniref:ABC transporter substrate-binding protein n=1 Tax=Paramicrobacterium chengjingii TaxID=2769067 RepID=UPI0014211088|nr:sugar ABC transporter substrate-binding protein [Microbacterium chengjingii]
MTRKSYLLTAIVAVAAITLVGCSSGDSGSSGDSSSGKLRMSVWSSDEAQMALFNSIADEYMEQNPEITSIKFESLPFDDYNTTLTTQVAGGNAPDLAWVGDISKDLIAADALMPLNDAFSGTDDWEFDDVLPSLKEQYSKDGELYAFPFSNSPYALYVNTDLLAEADQTWDGGDVTWDDIAAKSSAVNQATGKAGLVIRDFDFSSWQHLESVWAGWGGSPWNSEGTTCTFDSPEMTEAFQFIHDSIFVDGAMPGPGVTADFFAGDSAFTVAQVSRASLLDGSFQFDIAPLPNGPAEDYAVIGQAGMGVLKSSPNAEQAVDFLTFLTNPENSAKLAQFFPPPRESLLTGDKLAEVNDKLSAEQLQSVVIDELPQATTNVNHTNPAEIGDTVRVVLDELWSANADVPAALADVCGALDPMLSE